MVTSTHSSTANVSMDHTLFRRSLLASETRIVTPCDSSPCPRYSTCETKDEGYTCECLGGWLTLPPPRGHTCPKSELLKRCVLTTSHTWWWSNRRVTCDLETIVVSMESGMEGSPGHPNRSIFFSIQAVRVNVSGVVESGDTTKELKLTSARGNKWTFDFLRRIPLSRRV